jgi:hypothetical protein
VRWTWWVLLLRAVAAPAGALGQLVRPAAEAVVVTTRLESQVPAGSDRLSGVAFGAGGAVSVGPVVLAVRYVQGTLDSVSGGSGSRDVVEGGAWLGVRPVSWLTLEAGPQARAYVLSGGGATQRWVFWEGRVRAAAPFVGSAVLGYVELWRALGADVNVPEAFDHAQGGEAGMVVRLARAPLEARLAYRIDRAVLGGGSRRETVDGVVVTVGVRRR